MRSDSAMKCDDRRMVFLKHDLGIFNELKETWEKHPT
jgi:hypothetical protein